MWKVGMVALDHLVIKLDPTPKAPKVQQKNAMGKRHPNLGKRQGKLSNDGKGKYTKLILWMEEILHRLGCKETLSITGLTTNLNWFAGSLPSTVVPSLLEPGRKK